MNCWLIGITLQCLQPNNELIFLQNRNYAMPSNIFVYIPPEIKIESARRVAHIERCLDIGGSVAQQMACMNRGRR